jgi:hypothetical protein
MDLTSRNTDIANESQIEAPHSELTQNEAAQQEVPRLSGYFRLSHALFGDAAVRRLSGDSFRLFLWMSCQAWRFPDSDGTLRASVSFIELGTGISHATISRCLRQLKAEGLVSLVQTDFKRGNLWKVSRVAQPEVPQSESAPSSNQESTCLKTSKEVPHFEGQPRTFKKFQETKNSLSAAIANKSLREYFASIAEPRKRKSELMALQELLGAYSEADILIATRHVQAHGIGERGEPCHSPMAFLAKAIESVLVKAREASQAADMARSREVAARERQRLESEREKQEQQELDRKLREFDQAFPDSGEQRRVIQRLTQAIPALPEPARRIMAATVWAKGSAGQSPSFSASG